MIVVRFLGGLGNQMFQYAIGRSLSLKHEEELRLDTSFYTYDHFWTTKREFRLNHFSISGNVFQKNRISSSLLSLFCQTSWKHPSTVHTMYNRVFRCVPYPTCGLLYVHERIAESHPEFLECSDVYLDGNWQSEKYFQENAQQVREDFQIITSPSPENQKWIDFISTHNSVCLHVRRGDYVTDPFVGKRHMGTCSLDYYSRAIDYLSDKVDDLVFIVFSDDVPWVREHLHIPYPTYYMDHNDGSTDYEDMRLMSMCDHFITANSSFSWWGAWLGTSEDKIVVCPEKWYADETKVDIIPNYWVKM